MEKKVFPHVCRPMKDAFEKKFLFKKLEVSDKLLHLCTVKVILKSMQRTLIIRNKREHSQMWLYLVRGLFCI